MSTDTERRQLVRPDATIAYRVNGPDRAPLVVLLHGGTLDHHAWDAQVEALATRYRVVVPDLRGHGESTLQGACRFDDAVDDVAALPDEVDDGAPLVLGGLSLGGNIAQEIVHRTPDRVHALVVADSSCNTAARHPLARFWLSITIRCARERAGSRGRSTRPLVRSPATSDSRSISREFPDGRRRCLTRLG